VARVPPAALADQEVARVYLAVSLGEAQRVEAALDAQGVEYVVEVEPYRAMLLFLIPRTYHGAVFYVRAGHARDCTSLLRAAGLTRGLPED
jgi:hypothetical protein